MFSIWSPNGRSPSPTTVKEVNEHMQLMYDRMTDLEHRCREQAELLDRRDLEYQSHIIQLEKAKEREIVALKNELKKNEQRCAQYEQTLKDKDFHIAFLLHRCSFLDESASYVPMLENLTHSLKTAFSSAFQQTPGTPLLRENGRRSSSTGQLQPQLSNGASGSSRPPANAPTSNVRITTTPVTAPASQRTQQRDEDTSTSATSAKISSMKISNEASSNGFQ